MIVAAKRAATARLRTKESRITGVVDIMPLELVTPSKTAVMLCNRSSAGDISPPFGSLGTLKKP